MRLRKIRLEFSLLLCKLADWVDWIFMGSVPVSRNQTGYSTTCQRCGFHRSWGTG